MRRIIILVLILSITVSLSACSSSEKVTAQANSQTPDAVQTTTNKEKPSSGQKVLVVFFSSANSSEADAKSYATPYEDGVASTEYLANLIAERFTADIEKLIPVKPYSSSYIKVVAEAQKEADANSRPEFLPLTINPEDYDIIFIGYPVWWYKMPMIVYTFFDKYDLSGKTIVPFNTHEGSHDGGTYEVIRQLEPEAKVLDGYNVNGREVGKADEELVAWLNGLNFDE